MVCRLMKMEKNIRGTGYMVFNWFKWEKDEKEMLRI